MRLVTAILIVFSIVYIIMCIGSMVSSEHLPFGEAGVLTWYLAEIIILAIGVWCLYQTWRGKAGSISWDELDNDKYYQEHTQENKKVIEENEEAIEEMVTLTQEEPKKPKEEPAPLPKLDILEEMEPQTASHEEIISGLKQEHYEMFVQQLRILIEQEKVYLKAGIKLEEVAFTLGTNRTYLSRVVKSVYGHTFSEQMNIMRLRSAQQDLLSRRDTSIETIALSNGFNSANTFNKVFAQFMHTSPAAWRSAH